MKIDRDTVKREAVFNEERTHRYLWKQVWDKAKPLAAVIMLNPSCADTLIMDTTTYLVVNNVARLESFGGVIIVNIFSMITDKLSFKWNSPEEFTCSENDEYILKAAEESEKVIVAWGKGASANKQIEQRADEVRNALQLYKDKLFCITDGEKDCLHPLTPSVRSEWKLVPYTNNKAPA